MITSKKKYYLKIVLPAIIFSFIISTQPEVSFSQGIGISTVAITPDPSSVLEMRSGTQGVLVPRMTSAERDLIAAPAAGLLIYNTTTLAFNYYQAGWKALTAGGVTNVTGSGNISSSGGASPNLTFTGNLPVANLNFGTLASATTFWRGDGAWSALSANTLAGIVPVVNGGTGLSAGTSGGILGFSAAGTLASSPLLISKALVIGGGAGFTPSTLSLGTANQILGMNGAANANEYKTINGTLNQINLSHTANLITLSTPQDIHAAASPTFFGLTLSNLNANSFLYPNAAKVITSTASATNGQLLIGSTGAIPVAANLTAGNGIAITNGAGSVSVNMVLGTTNQMLGMNAAGTATEYKTIAGTANQINLVHGVNTITLSTPQNIHTTASPTFTGLTLTGLNTNAFVYSGAADVLSSTASPVNGQLLIGSTGLAPVAANLTAGNGITVTNGAGSVTISNAIPVTEASSTTAITSTSATFVTAAGMSIAAPSNGDYMVWFSTSLTNSNANRIVNISLFLNNAQVLASERFYEITGARLETPCSTQAYLTGVIAGQVIDLRWKNSGNTGTMDQRTLTIMRIK